MRTKHRPATCFFAVVGLPFQTPMQTSTFTMPNQFDKQDEKAIKISSKQKGDIAENRVAEIITLGSKGQLTCYTPNSDDDGIDLVVNPKGTIEPLFMQIKSRFGLQKGRFVQNVGKTTFNSNPYFYLLFIYFSQDSLEVEKLWLVPSMDFETVAYDKSAGKNYKSFYRISAGIKSQKDKWAGYSIDKAELGSSLQSLIKKLYQRRRVK